MSDSSKFATILERGESLEGEEFFKPKKEEHKLAHFEQERGARMH